MLGGVSGQVHTMTATGGNLMQRTRCPCFYDRRMACTTRDPGVDRASIGGVTRNHGSWAHRTPYPPRSADSTGIARCAAGPGRIEYMGQAIALVVAETLEAARHTAENLSVRYRSETVPVNPGAVTPDLSPEKQSAAGDLDQAMRNAAISADQVRHTPSHMSAAIAPHAAIAEWDRNAVTDRASQQMMAPNRKQMADAIGHPRKQGAALVALCRRQLRIQAGRHCRSRGRGHLRQETEPSGSDRHHSPAGVRSCASWSETRQRIRLAGDGQGVLSGIGPDVQVSNLPGRASPDPPCRRPHPSWLRRIHPRAGQGGGRHRLQMRGRTCRSRGHDPVDLRLRNIPGARHPDPGRPRHRRNRHDRYRQWHLYHPGPDCRRNAGLA